MNFKNELEEKCFTIARGILGSEVEVEHNKKIQIETALLPEVAAFSGPLTKEIDVLTTKLVDKPRIMLLVSCKQLSSKTEPAHIQEWGAVVQSMNKYSGGTQYLGLIVSPSGFSSGCDGWASSRNIGLIPPLKGRPLSFSDDTVLHMFERVLGAIHKRIQFPFPELMQSPTFYDFVYDMVSDYEGHDEAVKGSRYFHAPKGWLSSFGEMYYSSIEGRTVENLFAVDGATMLKLSGGLIVKYAEDRIDYGQSGELEKGEKVEPLCWKNLEFEVCSLDFIKKIVIGKKVTSAGDFREYLEFGLDGIFNLGIHADGFHIFSTESPIEDHKL